MILPTITSISIEVLQTVPGPLREAALALGATRWEAIRASLFAPGYSLPAVIANEFAEASGELHTGALAGGVALSVLMVPTLARSTEELVRPVPHALREGSLALGVPEWRTSLRVVLRTALGGIMTAILLSVARAAGETAPLLFTSLNNQYWNLRADQPTALTVQIYNYAVSPYQDWHDKAWSAALVLLLLVGSLSLAGRLLSRRRFR
jgi:phosphate transport system permease protein